MLKTKIIATIGPACNNIDTLQSMVSEGVRLFRINCSHTSKEELFTTFSTLRSLKSSAEYGSISILLDLPGPKLRVNQPNEPILLRENTEIVFKTGDEKSSPSALVTKSLQSLNFVKINDSIVLDDGKIVLQTFEIIDSSSIRVRVIQGGEVQSRKGFEFIDRVPDLPVPSNLDIEYLELAKQLKPDAIAVSFVTKANQIRDVKKILGDVSPLIVAKIERKEALIELEKIVDESDGIMVARGDLALSLPIEKTPRVQREIIELANDKGKFVIVATQMVSSMVSNPIPTRAEVTDVFFAVTQGADCVMLSDETAIGKYPVEAVQVMAKIITEALKDFNYDQYKSRLKSRGTNSISDAVAYAAAAACYKLGTKAIVCCTTSGLSVRLLSRYRPYTVIFGFTRDESVARKLNFYWGTESVVTHFQSTSDRQEREIAFKEVSKKLNLSKGERVIILGGLKVFQIGSTSIMEIKEVE